MEKLVVAQRLGQVVLRQMDRDDRSVCTFAQWLKPDTLDSSFQCIGVPPIGSQL